MQLYNLININMSQPLSTIRDLYTIKIYGIGQSMYDDPNTIRFMGTVRQFDHEIYSNPLSFPLENG